MISEKTINGYALEICSNSPASAFAAQRGGATRVEFCQNLESGGLTPSYGQLKALRKHLTIGAYVLIRPRSGDFLYSPSEINEIRQDVQLCKDLAFDGVVIGFLTADGDVDVELTSKMVKLASPMKVVFHRAFDLCRDPEQALEDIITTGCARILTSGQQNSAYEGISLIRGLIEQAAGRIEIMPGAGVDENNVVEILRFTGARSIHSSAKVSMSSAMRYKNVEVDGMDEPILSTSEDRVRLLIEKIQEMG